MKKIIRVVGAGPAGLMAAEVMAQAGHQVHVHDAMPSVGRKFLLAGIGGLNLTHGEPFETFVGRYGARALALQNYLSGFGPDALRQWAEALGVETFVGSSGRVFPKDMKAAPLLRHWLHRLRTQGVHFHMRERWLGWPEPLQALQPRFATPSGEQTRECDALVLALGGASWARLGSDGAWFPWLQAAQVPLALLQAANCGFDVATGWSEHFTSRFAGQPLKSVKLSFTDDQGQTFARVGECVATGYGLEGSLIYAAASLLREHIARQGQAIAYLDLLPHLSEAQLLAEVAHPRGSRSLSSHLKSRLPLDGVKLGLLYELLGKETMNDSRQLAAAIKALPIHLASARPIDQAISTAGGVRFDGLTPSLMLRQLPGVFCAGEMLDWEAPTGGYLLTACFATGRAAGQGVVDYLAAN